MINNWMAKKLYPHIRHNIVCSCYGEIDNSADICIECEDCYEILVSAEDFNDENAEDETADNWMAKKLYPHIGHNMSCTCCGSKKNPDDICIKCKNCGEVLISAKDFEN